MPTIGQITRAKPVEATVDLGDGDSLNLTFDRNRVTPAWIAEAERRAGENDVMALAAALADVIQAWDVTADDGSEFPPTTENIALLSYATDAALVTALIESSAPSRAEGNASPELSSIPPSGFTPPQPTPLNGPATSPSPAPSASPSPT